RTYHQYSSDLFSDLTVDMLDDPARQRKPWYLWVNYVAPHTGGPDAKDDPKVLHPDDKSPIKTTTPAPEDENTFDWLDLPRTPDMFEEDTSDKAIIRATHRTVDTVHRQEMREARQQRIEALQSVDRAVARTVRTLRSTGQLDNTYIVFTSDNGYFSGEHRIRQGKYLPHEPASHVPLMIRGPGIPAGGTSDELVSNVDIASTIAQMAGASPQLAQDGRSLLAYAQQPSLRTTRPILLEGDTGSNIDDEGAEGLTTQDQSDFARFQQHVRREKKKLRRRCKKLRRKSPRRAILCYREGVRNIEQEPVDTIYKLRAPAYRGIRTDRYALFLYGTGEVELYDMWRDPFQLKSVSKNRRYRNVRKALLADLDRLARCSGAGCTAALGPDPRPAKKRKKRRPAKLSSDRRVQVAPNA
ncbi:MAG TPA: sulfatase-like hydrolase/transferase, partial [Solirubrobacterales bacterium]|nr:sulfatase-like hydrolase/transferase [Solirubrobacterales bacterium]